MIEGTKKLGEICGAGTYGDQYACIEGAIERFGRYHPDEAAAVCTQVKGWQKTVCDAAVKHGMYDLAKPFWPYPR